MFIGTLDITLCCASDWSASLWYLSLSDKSLSTSLNCSIRESFSVCASDLRAAPSNDTSEPGIGTDENFSLIAPNNSLANANVYFLIHCLPTSFILL